MTYHVSTSSQEYVFKRPFLIEQNSTHQEYSSPQAKTAKHSRYGETRNGSKKQEAHASQLTQENSPTGDKSNISTIQSTVNNSLSCPTSNNPNLAPASSQP